MSSKILLILLALLVMCIQPFIGHWYENTETLIEVILTLRVPRILLGFFVGASLGVVGNVYQRVFQNSLASPYTLGVSSGASLAAGLAILNGWALGSVTLGGVLGAVITISLVMILFSGTSRALAPLVLLFGVLLSFFSGSLLLFLQYLSDGNQVLSLYRWLMGSLQVVGYFEVVCVAVLALISFFLLLLKCKEIELLGFGEEYAISKGVDIRNTLWITLLVTSLLVGVIVSICGPIGFVGVAVPYIARSIYPYSFRVQMIGSFLLGGIFLSLCDSLGRSIIHPSEIPVGIVAAVIGAPIAMYALIRSEQRKL